MPKHEFLFNGESVESSVENHGKTFRVTVGERQFEVCPLGNNLFATTVNGRKRTVAAAFNKGVFYLDIDAVQLELQEPGEDQFSGAAGDHSAEKDKIYAPMPGKIVKILVAVGEEVSEKQPMVIVEAMKMENPVNAAAGGRVKAVNFKPGDQVDTDSPIIELEIPQ